MVMREALENLLKRSIKDTAAKPSSSAMTKSNDESLEVLEGSNKQKGEGMITQI